MDEICRSCGETLRPGEEFCPQCGAPAMLLRGQKPDGRSKAVAVAIGGGTLAVLLGVLVALVLTAERSWS